MLSAFWGLQGRDGGRSETGRGGKAVRTGEEEAGSRPASRDLVAHLRRRRCRTREPRRTSELDGASGRAVPNGRGLNPWPAPPVWDPALTPAPRQPLPGRSGFASGCRLPPPPAARGPGAGTPPAICSRAGSSRVGFIPSPPPEPGPQVGSGENAVRGEARPVPLGAARRCWRELADSCKLSASEGPGHLPPTPPHPALLPAPPSACTFRF